MYHPGSSIQIVVFAMVAKVLCNSYTGKPTLRGLVVLES
jgi:hypothetical protein